MKLTQSIALFALTALAHDEPETGKLTGRELKKSWAEARSVNGRCSNGGSADGICISTSSCAQYGGVSDPGSPGAYTCPGTPGDVQCCSIISHCPNHDYSTLCTWTDRCVGSAWTGTILPDPVCPGGSDFVCCDAF